MVWINTFWKGSQCESDIIKMCPGFELFGDAVIFSPKKTSKKARPTQRQSELPANKKSSSTKNLLPYKLTAQHVRAVADDDRVETGHVVADVKLNGIFIHIGLIGI